ncbi:MAG TPA: hypothetical protein VFP61_02750 [Acidimicrobiales bacterium]|nr:hypothetical protein [Acidimicrobiales bacterium]
MTPAAPAGAHEWVSFADPAEDRTWMFDVTFLLSPWTCIFGGGCQGVLTGPAPELEQGCCSYGAHFTDDADVARVRAAAARLDAEQWQHKAKARRGLVRTDPDGTRVTRLVDGACIFLNRPGWPTGAGCALHHAAVADGRQPLEDKPDVCWQLPLRREDTVADDGHVTSRVSQWDRSHWGAGGAEFAWWCTEEPDAFVGRQPVYREMGPELAAMCGPAVQTALAAYLDGRAGTSTPLPHPVVRG